MSLGVSKTFFRYDKRDRNPFFWSKNYFVPFRGGDSWVSEKDIKTVVLKSFLLLPSRGINSSAEGYPFFVVRRLDFSCVTIHMIGTQRHI